MPIKHGEARDVVTWMVETCEGHLKKVIN